MSATVPLYIAALNLHCHSAAIYSRFKSALPQCRQAYTHANIIYIYSETTTATLRIKMLAVNIF